MATKLSEEQVKEALESYASEPVHIPGQVQTFSALVAFDPKSEE